MMTALSMQLAEKGFLQFETVVSKDTKHLIGLIFPAVTLASHLTGQEISTSGKVGGKVGG